MGMGWIFNGDGEGSWNVMWERDMPSVVWAIRGTWTWERLVGRALERVCGIHYFGIAVLWLGRHTNILFSYGGREISLQAKAKTEANQIAQDGKSIAGDAKTGAEGIIGDVKQKAGELKQKVAK